MNPFLFEVSEQLTAANFMILSLSLSAVILPTLNAKITTAIDFYHVCRDQYILNVTFLKTTCHLETFSAHSFHINV